MHSTQHRVLTGNEALYFGVTSRGGNARDDDGELANRQEVGLAPPYIYGLAPPFGSPSLLAPKRHRVLPSEAAEQQRKRVKKCNATRELSGKFMEFRQQQDQKYAVQRRVQEQLKQEALYKEQLLYLERRPERQLHQMQNEHHQLLVVAQHQMQHEHQLLKDLV